MKLRPSSRPIFKKSSILMAVPLYGAKKTLRCSKDMVGLSSIRTSPFSL